MDSMKNTEPVIKEERVKLPAVSPLTSNKHVIPHNHVQPQPIQCKPMQLQAMVQPSVQAPTKVSTHIIIITPLTING